MAKSVLLVEDDESLRDVFATALRYRGYFVFEAADGATGLAAAQDHRPDLVVLDLMVPGMSGLDIATVLKTREDTQDQKILMITALEDPRLRARASELKVERYRVKPVDPADVVAEVNTLIGEP